jgi:hypothetical protein
MSLAHQFPHGLGGRAVQLQPAARLVMVRFGEERLQLAVALRVFGADVCDRDAHAERVRELRHGANRAKAGVRELRGEQDLEFGGFAHRTVPFLNRGSLCLFQNQTWVAGVECTHSPPEPFDWGRASTLDPSHPAAGLGS